jgi:hypothetical protein
MKDLAKVRITLKGTNTLLMHNPRGIDPRDPMGKQTAALVARAKKAKTDEAWMEAWHAEYLCNLYWDEKLGPYLTGQQVFSSIWEGAKLSKKGVTVQTGLIVLDDKIPLLYEGPRDPEELWADNNFVSIRELKVMTAKVMRCRPQFQNWAIETEAQLFTEVLEVDQLRNYAEAAGFARGIGDSHRTGFGRFTVSVEEI